MAPAVLGAVFYLILLSLIQAIKGDPSFILTMPILLFPVLFFSLGLSIIPSIGYVIFMEIAFSKGMRPRSVKTIMFSSLLGLIAGLLIALFVAASPNFSKKSIESAFMLIAIGSMVGVSLGSVIYTFGAEKRASGAENGSGR